MCFFRIEFALGSYLLSFQYPGFEIRNGGNKSPSLFKIFLVFWNSSGVITNHRAPEHNPCPCPRVYQSLSWSFTFGKWEILHFSNA